MGAEKLMFFMLETKKNAYEARYGDGLSPTPHLHSHIELILVSDGVSVGTADDREGEMGPGDLFIAFPNQIHYYLDQTASVAHRILIVSPDICPEFSQIFKTMIPATPVLRDAAQNRNIAQAFDGILAAHDEGAKFASIEARGHLLVLFSEILRTLPLSPSGSCETDIVKSIIQFCYENYDTDISLKSISDSLHVSRYYISHIFNNKLHLRFNDYINSLRISRAAEMLTGDKTPITEIAYTVGYNSIRTFNRCFRDVMHLTPKEYRLQKQKSKDGARG